MEHRNPDGERGLWDRVFQAGGTGVGWGVVLLLAVAVLIVQQVCSLKQVEEGAFLRDGRATGWSLEDGAMLEAREARMASSQLAARTAELSRELAEAKHQVLILSEALAEARGEADAWKARQSKAWMDEETVWSGPAGLRRDAVALLDVNEDLRMVVLDAGRSDGVRPGMVLRVMREGRMLAHIRVTDVRAGVSGAVLEEVWPDGFPRKGDRVVLGKPSGR